MKKYNEEEIKKLLSDMPKMEDKRSFDDYFNQIQKEVTTPQSKPKKQYSKIAIPILTTAAAFMFMFLLLTNLNGGTNESSDFVTMDQNANADDADANESFDMEQVEDEADEMELSLENDEVEANRGFSEQSMVLTNDQVTGRQLVTFFVPDNQVQYMIPITIDVGNESPHETFNNHSLYIEDELWGLNSNIYNIVQFEDFDEMGVPVITVDDQQLQGSAMEVSLFATLTFFNVIGHDHILLQSSGGGPVKTPHGGDISEFYFNDSKYAYSLYETPLEGEYLWAPLPLWVEHTIRDAFEMMREAQHDFNILPSIPSDYDFEVNEEEDILVITFTKNHYLVESEEMLYFVEGILLTAKSFGFAFVDFQSVGDVTEIGPYTLTEPVPVPAYINPK